ncbi:MAG TPA: hypothetical protein VLA26_09345 [Gammaproteobacteria bacterium]|nr:hypothetical protein [Gammaproteobacteria bacterium]
MKHNLALLAAGQSVLMIVSALRIAALGAYGILGVLSAGGSPMPGWPLVSC